MTKEYKVKFFDEEGDYLDTESFIIHEDEDLTDAIEEFIAESYGDDFDIEYDIMLIDVYG